MYSFYIVLLQIRIFSLISLVEGVHYSAFDVCVIEAEGVAELVKSHPVEVFTFVSFQREQFVVIEMCVTSKCWMIKFAKIFTSVVIQIGYLKLPN